MLSATLHEFQLLTCATDDVSVGYLTSFGFDVSRAVNAYFDDKARLAPPPAAPPAPPPEAPDNAIAPDATAATVWSSMPTERPQSHTVPDIRDKDIAVAPQSVVPEDSAVPPHRVATAAAAPMHPGLLASNPCGKRDREVIYISDSSDADDDAPPSSMRPVSATCGPLPSARLHGRQSPPPMPSDPSVPGVPDDDTPHRSVSPATEAAWSPKPSPKRTTHSSCPLPPTGKGSPAVVCQPGTMESVLPAPTGQLPLATHHSVSVLETPLRPPAPQQCEQSTPQQPVTTLRPSDQSTSRCGAAPMSPASVPSTTTVPQPPTLQGPSPVDPIAAPDPPAPPRPPIGPLNPLEPVPCRKAWDPTAQSLLGKCSLWTALLRAEPPGLTRPKQCAARVVATLPCLAIAKHFLPDATWTGPSQDEDARTVWARSNAQAIAAMLYVHCRNVREHCTTVPAVARAINEYCSGVARIRSETAASDSDASTSSEDDDAAVNGDDDAGNESVTDGHAKDLPPCPCTDGVAFFNLANFYCSDVFVGTDGTSVWESSDDGSVIVKAQCAVDAVRGPSYYECVRTLESAQAIAHFQIKDDAEGRMIPVNQANAHVRWMTSVLDPTFANAAPPETDDDRTALLTTRCGAGLPMAAARVPGLDAELSGHQRESLQWMMEREEHEWYRARILCADGSEVVLSTVDGKRDPARGHAFGTGGRLRGVADEMGLGKTVTALALIAARPATAVWLHMSPQNVKATLVVVPVSLGVQWEREVAKFLPRLKFHMIHSSYSRRQTPVSEADIVVVTYDTLVSRLTHGPDPNVKYAFHRVIYDEVQQGLSRRGLEELAAVHRWAMSGTPPVWNGGMAAVVRRCTSSAPVAAAVAGFKRSDHTYCRVGDNQPKVDALDIPVRRFSVPLLISEQERAMALRHVKSDPAVIAALAIPPRHTDVVRVVLPGPERRSYAVVEQQTRRDLWRLRHEVGQLGAEQVMTLIGWVDRLRRVATEAELARLEGVLRRHEQHERHVGQVAQQTTMVRAADALPCLLRDHFAVTDALRAILQNLAADPPVFDECVVCLDQLQRPVVLRCGHVFCHECVTNLSNNARAAAVWFAPLDPRCPLCKQQTLDGPKLELLPRPVELAPGVPASASSEDTEEGTPGGKVGAAVRLIAALLEQRGTKVLVFSVYPAFLSTVNEQLSRQRIRCFEITGSMPMKKRGNQIAAFQDPQDPCRVCLLSSRAGDAGLTLTAANHVVLLEPSLNATVDAQAIGRVHRFGQRREVTVHRVVVKGTVEERVQSLLDQGRLVTMERAIGRVVQDRNTAEVAAQLSDIIARDAI